MMPHLSITLPSAVYSAGCLASPGFFAWPQRAMRYDWHAVEQAECGAAGGFRCRRRESAYPRSMDTDDPESLAPIELPIDGVLDLHAFAPADVKELVADYVEECAQRGIQQVRIIHGKGQGVLRRIVHGVLQRHPRVHAYALADPSGGGWGATVVQLRI